MSGNLPPDARPQTKRRVDYRPPAFLVDRVGLEIDLDPAATEVKATLAFRRNPAAQGDDRWAPLVLDGEQQENVRVELNGRALGAVEAVVSDTSLTLPDAPDSGTVVVRSRIAPEKNVALEGLYVSSGVFTTQCEAEGFRRIAYFPDRPDVLSTFTVTIRGDRDRYPVMLSNGNLVAAGALPGARHFATWHDPFPKPSYLFALVAGDLASLEDTFTTTSGRRVHLSIYSTPPNIPRCHWAMESLKRAMRWDEERFGREYDLDRFMIFCADDFNMGAMENKGLNIFNSKLVLADPQTATDDDYNAIEAVIGHEYFHNWTGNRVTCRDWFQLSLKEGLTVFRDQEFSSDMGSRAVERIGAVENLRRMQLPEDAGPMAHPVRPDEYQEINNFYTATVYEKGAEVIRMQHALLGQERFRRGMDLYFERHDGQAVTCDDFVQAMADASGVDLAQFRRWYSQAGTPAVRASGRYDAATRRYELTLAQHTDPTPGQPEKLPFHIPFAVGLVGPDGRDLALHREGASDDAATTLMLDLVEPSRTFTFVDVASPPVPSLARGYSAPVRVEFEYTDADLQLLASHDSDPVNRWDAAQRIFTHAIRGIAAQRRDGRPPVLPDALVSVAAALLDDRESDPALIALSLAPPDPSYVASLDPEIDVDGVDHARAFVFRELACTLSDRFERVYSAQRRTGTYQPSPKQAAKRRLANLCLRYLGERGDAAGRAFAVEQFENADNMTDTIGALAALVDTASDERARLYGSFEQRWQDEPLVLDKWFALEALSRRPGTLARVRELVRHPRYNAKNPNRVRALLGAFALRNFPRFHAADGSGYAFVADQVLAIDRMNPQLAARLAGAFELWKRLPEPRRGRVLVELERIAATPALSPDVREIVSRSLAD